MAFSITIIFNRKRYTYKVQRIALTNREESYKIIGKNKSLIFTNNRPLLKAKKLKHWKPEWKMEGELWNVHFKSLIIEALDKAISE